MRECPRKEISQIKYYCESAARPACVVAAARSETGKINALRYVFFSCEDV